MSRAIVLDLDKVVNTDQILSGQHAPLPDYVQHLFEKSRPDITRLVQTGKIAGSIIVAGRNFGSGSSRERAATGLKQVGIEAVVAVSYNPTWERNAINCGLRTYRFRPEVVPEISDGGDLEVYPNFSILYDRTAGRTYGLMETPEFILAILDAGGLVEHVRRTHL